MFRVWGSWEHGRIHQQPPLKLLPRVLERTRPIRPGAVHHPGGTVPQTYPLPPLLHGPEILYRIQDRPARLHSNRRYNHKESVLIPTQPATGNFPSRFDSSITFGYLTCLCLKYYLRRKWSVHEASESNFFQVVKHFSLIHPGPARVGAGI